MEGQTHMSWQLTEGDENISPPPIPPPLRGRVRERGIFGPDRICCLQSYGIN